MEATFHVRGMTCQHCAATVTDAVQAVAGVAEPVVDWQQGRVTLRVPDAATLAAARRAVAAAGYEVADGG